MSETMTESVPEIPAPQELQIAQAIWLRRYRIGLLAFVVGLMTAGATLLIPNAYQASSAILIKDPELPITGEAPPLSIEALRALCESTSVKQAVYDEVTSAGLVDAGKIRFREFQKSLTTSLQRKTARDPSLVPMIQLNASAASPATAAAIANIWLHIALKRGQSLHTSGVAELNQFTQGMLREADQSLLRSEEALTSAVLAYERSLAKSQLEGLHKSHALMYAQLLSLKDEEARLAASVSELERLLSEREINGVWAGESFERAYRAQRSVPVYGTTSTPVLRIKEMVEHLVQTEETLAKFEEESQLQFNEMELAVKEKQLEQMTRDIVSARDSLANYEAQYKELENQLRQLPEKIALNKAVTDEALWRVLLGQDRGTSIVLTPLVTEVTNAVYEETKKAAVRLAGDIQGQRGRLERFIAQNKVLNTEVNSLASTVSLGRSRRESLARAIERDKTALTFIQDLYNDLRQKYETQLQELGQVEARRKAQQKSVDEAEQLIRALEAKNLVNEDKIAALERDVENRRKVRASAAAKADEIALLSVSVQNVSRAGMAPLYEAGANPQKIGPRRSLIVLMAMFATAALASMVVVVNHLLKSGLAGASRS